MMRGSAAVGLALLALWNAAPVFADPEARPDTPENFSWRDSFLNNSRDKLLGHCARGRELNKEAEMSYWDPILVNHTKERMAAQGAPSEEVESFFSGLTDAMKVACPDVW